MKYEIMIDRQGATKTRPGAGTWRITTDGADASLRREHFLVGLEREAE